MIWSGLRIYWAERVYAFGIGSWQWFAFFPDAVYETLGLERRLARGMAFHFAFGWLFVFNGLAYVIYLAWSKEWRHILPDRKSAKEAKDVVLHDLHLRDEAPPQGRYNAAQRISYTIVLVMAAIIVVSGFAIYKPTQLHPLPLLFGGYQGARLTHFSMTIGIAVCSSSSTCCRSCGPGGATCGRWSPGTRSNYPTNSIVPRRRPRSSQTIEREVEA